MKRYVSLLTAAFLVASILPAVAGDRTLEERVSDLEARVTALEGSEPDPGEPDHGEPDPDADPGATDPDPDPRHDDPEPVVGTVTGHHSGFTVAAGETVEVLGDVTSDANVVVYGTLKMRAGSSLTFVDVDESAFTPGSGDAHHPLESDVGLWVFGSGQLDIRGSAKQGWNRTGTHATWEASDEYVAAPNGPPRSFDALPWNLGDDVPCLEFAGEEYCTEIINLTRDVTIKGTEGGKAHIFVRSDQPQTIRYAVLSHLGPNGDGDVDGRYPLHFHHMHDGARGSLIEGVVVRDSGDHAFVPHTSHGMTFRDTVAYNVSNTPYWWDERDLTDDVTYDRALAVQVHEARDTRTSLSGFLMGSGTGNVCNECVAAGVAGRTHPSAGYRWTQPEPNLWEFVDSVSHNNQNGVWHWRNKRTDQPPEDAHIQSGFVTYNNAYFGIEQGSYANQSFWYDAVSFGNRKSAVKNRSHPRIGSLDPGIGYIGGTYGAVGSQRVIDVSDAAVCARGKTILFEAITLFPGSSAPIYFDHDKCRHEDDWAEYEFRNVVIGAEGRDLDRSDFEVKAIPPGSKITVHRTDGGRFTIER
jgi:hypothetical protein